jgi:hypothetical protein
MPIDTQVAVDRCNALLPTLDPQMKIYLEVALREAQLMQLVRQVAAGEIEIDGSEDED